MQKIFLILVSLIITSFSYAFEGIINQTYTDINTKEKSTFKWTISGDNVRLDILKGDDVITILPQLQSNAIAYFGNKADQNGVFWYSTSPVSQIEAKVPNMRILEQNESQYYFRIYDTSK